LRSLSQAEIDQSLLWRNISQFFEEKWALVFLQSKQLTAKPRSSMKFRKSQKYRKTHKVITVPENSFGNINDYHN